MFLEESATKAQDTDEVLMKAFDLEPGEIFEAKFNLLGFFGTLQKIKWRLEKEGKL